MKLENIAGEYTRTKYAMYLRKSRADLELEAMGEEETLARHKKMLFNLAAKHNISTEQIDIYHEIVSGDSIEDRPEMQRLLDGVWEKKYKGVLVVEVERLARGNTKDQGEVAEAFQMSDTPIITPVKTYDPQNEYDQEYFEFGLFMSRREYKTIRRRLVNGKHESVKEGNYLLPQRIFGYNISRLSKKDRILVPNEAEVPFVKMIFDWFTEEGHSTDWIARRMSQMDIKTSRGSSEWHKSSIRDILGNKHYIGKVTWGRSKIERVKNPVTGKLERKAVQTGKEEVYEGKHEGIISVEQFEKVEKIISNRNHTPVNQENLLKNPFAGILVCCDCGKAMQWFDMNNCKSKQKHSYSIRIRHRNSFFCQKKSLPVDDVQNAIIEALKAYIQDFEIKIKNDGNSNDLLRHQQVIESMESELTKLNSMKQTLFTSWEAQDGTYTRDEFIERKQMYTVSIDRLKEQIAAEKASAPVKVDYSEKIILLHSIIDCIKNPDIDAKAKNVFLKEYIDKITYDAIDYGQNKGGKPILEVFLK